MFFVALVAAAVIATLLVVVAKRRGALLRAVAIGVASGAALWAVDFLWMQLDPTGAGGWVDCWPSCSLKQDIAALGFWLPPMFVALLLVASAVAAGWVRARR